ncbi:MAG TPA: DUF4389 domain-containing protein [Woeseiaceae bacterium]|jgi:hypothetical protein|nr:DUF4389 domain-containing protein [Woeseiaceae bacterium]
MSSEEPPRDHAPGDNYIDPDDRTGNRKIEENVKSRSTWLRALFMVVFVFIYAVSRFVVGTVVVLQFFWVLFTGETNRNLLVFGHSLATYTSQIILYLTYNSNRRPFPFDEEWPPARLED